MTLSKYLKGKGYKVEDNSQFIIGYGELPICLVAHLDTVGKTLPIDIYYDNKQQVMWSPDLLGADDRAGVYAIIQIIERGYRPNIIFTTDEETGAVGARALVTQKPDCPLENLKAIFQLDRRGANDCVFYDCDNRDFVTYIEKFGFKEAYGSFSDISVIAPAWGVAAVNLSVGYYEEHSSCEHLKCIELEATIEKVCNMLDCANEMLSYVYIAAIPSWNSWDWSSTRCVFCAKPLKKGDYRKIKEYNYIYKVCNECYNIYYNSFPGADDNA